MYRLLQKLRRNPGQHEESRNLLSEGAQKWNRKYGEESDDFQYYTHSNTEVDNSPFSIVPENWPPPRGHHADPFLSFIKYLMFFLNFIFFILGFGLLCIGFWGLVDKQSLMGEQINNLGTDPMLVFVLVGLVICVLSLSGCLGFIRENICLLKFFFTGITTLLVVQCVVALVVVCFHKQIEDSLKTTMMVAVNRYQDDSDLKFILDEIQLGMECCGVQSYHDWTSNLYFNCSSPGVNSCGVPYSCCIDPLQNGTVPNSQCGFGALGMSEATASSLIYLGGCIPQLVLWINRRIWDIAAAYMMVAATELVCIVCAQRVLSDIRIVKSIY
ncbi:tetraspanin-10 [Ranitomeya variabilis]|uniref:tetraspanin-10 n=1 Tax=Ranitomeya variabilis TaxID=490064 RepID=UPI0040562B27